MPRPLIAALIAALVASLVAGGNSPLDAQEPEAPPAGVATILEDNAEALLPLLTNPTGDSGEGHVEKEVVFSGASAVKIVPMQRFCNFIPDWAYRITENPKAGEYRYLRFAWKSDGLAGIMLQLHDTKDWYIRYTAGIDKFGWGTKYVAPAPPGEWSLVTVDLFQDFGERELHGIALTAFDGRAAYFDHIYFGRSVAELDAIDATGLSEGEPLRLSADDIEQHWQRLGAADASLAYRSFWTLVAAGRSAAPILQAKLGEDVEEVDDAKIKRWLKELDDESFSIREAATAQLEKHLNLARKLAEEEFRVSTSPEARSRLRSILVQAAREATETERVASSTRRILSLIAAREKK